MNITVAGVGYVGLAQAVLLAQHNAVTAVTTTPAKAENINRGVSPIVDAEITDFLRTKPLTLTATVDAERAYRTADVVIIATPTDYDPERNLFNTSTVEAVLTLVGRVNPGALVVIKSTVPVGYTERIVGRFCCARLLFSPEFLREGFAIHDFFNPDRIVIGTENDKARDVMLELYRPFAGKSEFLCVKRRSSETIKYASNAFLAMKIHYINEMADFCECAGADIREVAKGMGLDSRIGKKFLNPGPGYGGSCFPKDTNAMAQMGKKFGAHLTLIETTIAQNDARKARMGQRVIEAVKEHPEGKIAVLGLAFKGGTDDCRESPAIDIIKEMIKYSRNITVYDPKALENAKSILNNTVQYAESVEEACRDAEVAVILTEWEDFKHLDLERLKKIMRHAKIVDMRNMLCGDAVKEAGFDYQCVGRKK